MNATIIEEHGKATPHLQVIPMKDRIAVHAIMAVVDRHLRKRFIRTTSASIKRRGMHDLLAYVRRDMAERTLMVHVTGYKFDIHQILREREVRILLMYCVSPGVQGQAKLRGPCWRALSA